MTEQQTITATTDNNGLPTAIPPAKRDAPRGMLPSTLMGCSLRVEYTDSDGSSRETSGVLLDWCPVEPVLNIRGARTLVSCDRIGILELVE